MEETQGELAEGAKAPEASPVAPEVQAAPQVQAIPEPRHPLQDILDKAKARAEEAAKPQEPVKTEVPVKAPDAWTIDKWDGNPTTLPDKLKKIVTDNQAAYTQKAQEVAQLKQAYEGLRAQVEAAKPQASGITQEEFEAAQLDPNKFLALTRKVANMELEREKAALQPMLQDIQMKQLVSENEAKINSFATQHPDFWELHDKGLIQPLIQVTGNLEASYQQAKTIANNFKNSVKQEMQQQAQVKKSAGSLAPTTPQQVEVVYVDPGTDTTFVAAKYAMEGKRVTVKVRPK